MGYDVHVTRAEHWAQNEGHEILASEWLDLIEHDPELRLAGYNGPNFAIWSGDQSDAEAWLDWIDGNITTKNPSERLLGKMVEIARRLGARVQGDEGEWYPEAAAITDARQPLPFSNLCERSFLLAVCALLALPVLLGLNSVIEQRYPVGTPRPIIWAISLAGVMFCCVMCWLLAIVFAGLSLLAPQPSRRLALAALLVNLISLCIFLLFAA